MSFGKLNDVEGIHLRRREGGRHIPRIPETCADVFGSSVRPRLMELCISKDDLLIPGTARIKRRPIATKASKARHSDGRRRPPAARRDHQGIAVAIMWIRDRYHRRRGRKRPRRGVFCSLVRRSVVYWTT